MNKTIEQAINKQINEELFSGYLYLAMAAYDDSKNLRGFANWFEVQAKEEGDHATGLYRYLIDRGGQVELEALEKPQKDFKGPLDLFEQALKHEQHISQKINELYKLAEKNDDLALQSFLKWYIDEQVEEEASASDNIEKVKMIGKDGAALYMLDKDFQARTYTPASILQAE